MLRLSALPYHCCIVSPEGTLILPIRWNGDDPIPSYVEVQMLDEAGRPIPQPYPDPPKYKRRLNWKPLQHWVIDFLNLPLGWQMVELTAEQWEDARVSMPLKQWDFETGQIVIRPECEEDEEDEPADDQPRRKVKLTHAADIELSHYARGGRPIWRLKKTSTKKETDFADVTFTLKLAGKI